MVYLWISTVRVQLAGAFELKKKYLSVFFLTCNTAFQRAKAIFSVPSEKACASPDIQPFIYLICGQRTIILWAFHTQCKLSFVFAEGGFWKGLLKNLTLVNEKWGYCRCMTFMQRPGIPAEAESLRWGFLGSYRLLAALNKQFLIRSWPWLLIAKLKDLTLNHS